MTSRNDKPILATSRRHAMFGEENRTHALSNPSQKRFRNPTELSSRPERSTAEGPAVLSATSKCSMKAPPPLCHPDRSEPGFPATLHRTQPRMRLSVKKGA